MQLFDFVPWLIINTFLQSYHVIEPQICMYLAEGWLWFLCYLTPCEKRGTKELRGDSTLGPPPRHGLNG